jgi:AbrB family looped-hinge helix DNA binding protein
MIGTRLGPYEITAKLGKGGPPPPEGPAMRLRGGRLHGMMSTMVTTMDSAGRLVIPSEIRREAAIEPGTPLDVRWRDGVIEIEPQPLKVKLQRKGRLLVATPVARVTPLRTATVERTRRQIGRRRDGR